MLNNTKTHYSLAHMSRELRCKLAAAYRVASYMDWDQIIFNHITARVPGSEKAHDGPHFLINPLGLRFDEVTASSLLRVTVEGKVNEFHRRECGTPF